MLKAAFRRRSGVLHAALLLNALSLLCSSQVEAKEPARVAQAKTAAKQQRSKRVVKKPKRRLIAQAEPAPAPAPAPPAPGEPAPAPAEPAPTPAEPGPAPAEAAPAEPPPTTDAVAPEAPPLGAEAAPAEPGPEEPYMDEELDVVKVTVDRREKDLQDYPGSASAFSEEDLKRVGVHNVRDMASATPYVEIGTQEGNTEIFIRGVGSDFNTELGDPAAATHIDGIYIPRPRGLGSMFFDVERVEMNRGPQGTLRGRNAIGGTLNIISKQPKLEEWGAGASFQVGNYSQRVGEAMLNIPIGERLALRVAAFSEVHAPFYENAGPVHTIEAAESADALAYRASAKWIPTDRVTVLVRHDYTQEGGTGYTGANFAPALQSGLLPEEVPNPRAVIYRGPQASQDLKHWGVSADVTVDVGPMLIGYLGGYRSLDYRQITGGNSGIAFPGNDNPEIDNWSSSYWHTASKSVVQEVRIFAPDTERFRWTVGGFFFNEDQTVFLGTTQDNSTDFAGVEFNMPDVNGRSLAGYTDATLDIVEALRATAGVRLTTESKERHGIGYIYGFSGISEPFRFGTEGFKYADRERTDYDVSDPPTIEEFRNGIDRFGARDTLDEALEQEGVNIRDNLAAQDGRYDDTFLDFRVGADGDLTKENMVYAMFSTGHKSGGFNDTVRRIEGGDIAPTYKPESLYAVEVGSKNEFLEKKLKANASVFWYEYRNQQFVSIREIIDTGRSGQVAATSVRFNAASSRILGLEADSTATLPFGFLASVAAMVLEPRFTEGEVADTRVGSVAGTQERVDLEGNFLPRAPRLTINYSIGQVIQTSIGPFDWLLAAQTKTKHYMTVFNGEGRDTEGNFAPNLSDVVPTYTRFDAGIGYTRPDGLTRIEGFVSNLTDVAYMTTILNTPGLNLRFFNPPRQFGLRLTVNL
jgi:iron complex outermembrane receptor protein